MTATTHPMESLATGRPITAEAMRLRVAELVGDRRKADQILAELAHWATRCAEVKHEGGDAEGSDKAMWMAAVFRVPNDDPYSDDDDRGPAPHNPKES